MGRSRLGLVLFVAIGAIFLTANSALAAGTASIKGRVIDNATGFALAGVLVTSEGSQAALARTDASGQFVLTGLSAGQYILLASFRGYETTASDSVSVATGEHVTVTLGLQRVAGSGSGIRVLGRTTVRASQALQKAAVIYESVSAQTSAKQAMYRAADTLRTLPAIVNDSSDSATYGDDVTLDIRGIGSLETTTLIDGHPTGSGIGGYNFDISPIFGLRGVNVVYGSGGGDLYGVDAIGGVIDMQTLDPTIAPSLTVTQGYGTFSKLISSVQATGTLTGGKLGYAIALGTQGQNGPTRHSFLNQPGAQFDPSSSNPAVRALGIYQDDASLTNKGELVKFRYQVAPNQRLTAHAFANSWWDDKTGNGDGDFLPYDTALAKAQGFLAAYTPPNNTPPFSASNLPNCQSGTFAATNAAGFPNGYMPDGVTPSGGILCQTAQQYAQFNTGLAGAGPAWQGFRNQDFSLRYDYTQGKSNFAVDAFTNRFYHTYDRTYTLPFPNAPFWQNQEVTSTGFTATDSIVTDANEIGFGFYYNNYNYYFFDNSFLPANNPAAGVPAPNAFESAFFVRDAYHAPSSPLTTYLNVWEKNASITNSSYLDPRLSMVYSTRNDVLRAAVGATSTQPTAFNLAPFTPNSTGAAAGGSFCNTLTSIGNAPGTLLKPERGVDEEFSVGHRFFEDSQIQFTVYNANVYNKIFNATVPLSTSGTAGIPPNDLQIFLNLLGPCGFTTQAQQFAVLGVSGDLNLGQTTARGVDINGRQRISKHLFTDYSYAITSSLLRNADPNVLQNNLALIPGSQLPGVPLHTYTAALDYLTGTGYEARLTQFYVSKGNAKNSPAYSYFNLNLSADAGRGYVAVNVSNLFQQNVQIVGYFGHGVPNALNQYAGPSDYQPLIGTAATERFGLTPRTIDVSYTLRVK